MYGLKVLLPVALLVALLAGGTEASRILGILPSVGRSHYIIGAGLMKALLDAGHEVTIVSPYPMKGAPPDRHRDILMPEFTEAHGVSGPDLFEYKNAPNLVVLYLVYNEFGPMSSEGLLQHPNVVQLMESGEKFDAVIVESFASEVLYGLAEHFGGQLIVFSPFGASMWTNELVGTPYPYSYIPHTFLSYTNEMSFWQRFSNALVAHLDKFYYRNVFLPKQEQLYRRYFPEAKLTFQETLDSVRLAFVNQHFTLSYPHPYAPNHIEIGGIQIQPPKELPEDLHKYIESSPHGVIYFSMGSMLKGRNFPEEKRAAFVNVFRGLKENVIWKYENESLPNRPKNVLIRSWMPQSDILAHPKVKLFITHGGLLGTTEGLYNGVPMVGIPIYGDQELNLARAEKAGYGVKLDYETLSEETISAAIGRVLSDPSYAKNAQTISRRYRDQPLGPAKTAVYWVEYVIRHGGAPQLQSPSVKLSFIEYNLLDVYAVMALIALSALIGSFALVKVTLKRLGLVKGAKSAAGRGGGAQERKKTK
ncbi:UDP-glycosyltransferase UGT5-like [Anopheles ziemanni]|uniref:UDP-glycosyltransferase UGT5-like n=1 Tax=Anopheles coustani TaxID=139045 RepID=UPI0026584601|nr:UDP-glycosyltransferase UGT5-like [Anopheles coustani]XP_058178491.1 UDP-glycosyltransferase UGT5-like [Anopheles ziemanni]